ncbi:CheY-like superfamily, partial [Ochromonadaceae sp. CCMP2298]
MPDLVFAPGTAVLSAPSDGGGMGLLLVVDDAMMSRKMLVRLLCAKKYTCVQAEDGLQALEVYRELLGRGGRLDAVLMDFEMPQMNGPTATWHLRQLGYSGLVIGVTGNVLPDDVSYFLSQGADYVLRKPLHMPDFEAKMDLHRAHQRAQQAQQARLMLTADSDTPTTWSPDGSEQFDD